MELLKKSFTAPSGNIYTIREQNGHDEDILTNIHDINSFMHLTNFIQAIVVSSSRKEGNLSVQDVLNLPVLDRYAILFQSRIFSIGNFMEFNYTWPNGETFEYEEDLENYLLPYGELDSLPKEQLEALLKDKPHAIPAYPKPELEKGIVIELESNKRVKFDLLDGNGEIYIAKLKDNEASRNSELIARNLCLEVDGRWERVYNFSLFSVKDMRQIRSWVHGYDPSFNPMTEVENPSTGEKTMIPVLASTSFFFPGDLEMMP